MRDVGYAMWESKFLLEFNIPNFRSHISPARNCVGFLLYCKLCGYLPCFCEVEIPPLTRLNPLSVSFSTHRHLSHLGYFNFITEKIIVDSKLLTMGLWLKYDPGTIQIQYTLIAESELLPRCSVATWWISKQILRMMFISSHSDLWSVLP